MTFLVLSKPGDPHEESFSKNNSYTMIFGRDIDGFATYGFKVIPSTVFFNAQGEAVGQHVGTLTESQLKSGVEQIL